MPQSIVLITGATSGFGEAAARIFARKGHDLILTGRRKERLEKVAEEIRRDSGRTVLTLSFDVRSHKACAEAIASLPPEWKAIEILVNNAGLAAGREAIHEANVDDWEQMIDTNVKGLLYMTRLITPLMIENKKGHVINVGSLAGREVYPGGNVYSATKFAVGAISRSMRLDLVEHGIRVSNIAPGLCDTEFSIVRFKGDESKAKAVYDGFQPLTATDVAEIIVWVAEQPLHINVDEVVVTPRAQGDTRTVARKKGF